MNEARSMPVKLRQPDSVEFVGLGAARDVLDLSGIDHPHHQAACFPKVVERFLWRSQIFQLSEVASRTTRSTLSSASRSATSMIALVLADILHTVVIRLPGWVEWGTRVHTMPESLATSIAATRATISSSIESTWTCFPFACIAHSPSFGRHWQRGGLPGGSVSYTHLRAHETVLDLVCRLLLEKK